MGIENFLEVRVLESTTDEPVELVPANMWCEPVSKGDLDDLKMILNICKVPHILAKVDYETLDSYKVGYTAFISSKYNRKFLPTGQMNGELLQ